MEPCSLEGGRFAGDYGLLLSQPHKHYAVGASLPKPVDNAGKVGSFFFPCGYPGIYQYWTRIQKI